VRFPYGGRKWPNRVMKKEVWHGLAQNASGIIALPAAIRFSGVRSVAGHVKNRSPTNLMDRCK
jgi:hypothetical protein